MKMPSISKDSLLNFFLQHGEKIVVVGIALLAMRLAWGGIDAIRFETVSKDKRPEALANHAARTLQHIDREKQAPADVAPKTPRLTKLVEPWRAPRIAPPPDMALLDRPLFEELARRTKPDVFPIEDLRAVAGITVLAVKDQGGRAADAVAEPPKKPKTAKGGKKAAAPEDPVAAMPVFGGGGPPGMAGDGTVQMPRGQITPYIVVTGLIPVAKQAGEYGRRFQSTSLRDEKRDSPLWSEYVVERSTVVPGGRETWERLDLKAVAKRARDQWAGVQGEPLPPRFLLSPEQTPGTGGIGYCAPLPQLAMQGWGPDSIHPWFHRELARLEEERKAEEKAARERAEAGADQATEPGFESPLADRSEEPGIAPEHRGPQGGLDPTGKPLNDLEYRLFRFVDTSVEPGKSYRYRVRLFVWNPNYGVAAQHLVDAGLAKDTKLASAPSNATDPVTIPETVTVLVRTLPKDDMKRFKPGMAEVLVLGPDKRTGNYSLRGVITDLGGFVNVDNKLNKTGDQRTRGEEIFTDGMLVDMVGRQENRDDLKNPKNPGPPEPLEMLVMRADGRFDVTSAATSAESVSRYLGTLPQDPKAAKRPADEEPATGSEPGKPFSFPGLGPR